MSISDIQKKISPVFREYGIKRAAIFGSVSRGEDTPQSDVDILVTLGTKPMGIFTFMKMVEDAELAVGKKIDLVTEGALNKFIRPHILKDLKTIYEG